MKIVDFNNTTHEIIFIPRFQPTGLLVLTLVNETTNEATVVNNTYVIADGYITITFDNTFIDKDRYSFNIKEGNNVVYRGKIYSTAEETQNYKQDISIYEY